MESRRDGARADTAGQALHYLKKTTVIYKMHGTVYRRSKWDNYVITEDDYVDFLSRMTGQTAVPALFMGHFATATFFFSAMAFAIESARCARNLRGGSCRAGPASRGHRQEESEAVAEEGAALRSWASSSGLRI